MTKKEIIDVIASGIETGINDLCDGVSHDLADRVYDAIEASGYAVVPLSIINRAIHERKNGEPTDHDAVLRDLIAIVHFYEEDKK